MTSLFDVEDVVTHPRVRDLHLGQVTAPDVREFARRYHYSGLGGNAQWRWGLWHGVVLYGVISYNLPTFSTCEAVFGTEHKHRVWHISKLAMADAAPPNSESRILGLSLAAVHRENPDVWAVVTYADPTVGHIGTIYQATNALYTGTGGHVHYWLDGEGNRRAEHMDGKTVTAETTGWTRHRGQLKHRYLYILGSRTQRRHRMSLLKLPVLPYPKGGTP